MEFVLTPSPAHAPFIETIWYSRPERAGMFTSTAASTWEIVVTKIQGKTMINARGPETRASVAQFGDDLECFGITFKLGTFMPQLSVKAMLDRQDTIFPEVSPTSFWMHGSAWELPTLENVDVFIQRLIRQDLLVRDHAVEAALRGATPNISLRSLQYRFVQATGLSHKTIQQIERANQAAGLLQHGVSIEETAFSLGYFDQSHLTNSLRRFIGKTPAQLAR